MARDARAGMRLVGAPGRSEERGRRDGAMALEGVQATAEKIQKKYTHAGCRLPVPVRSGKLWTQTVILIVGSLDRYN